MQPTSHIFVTSANRNRNKFPNPSNFEIRYSNTVFNDRLDDVRDYVSDAAPLVSANLLDSFDDTDVLTFPYYWFKDVTIIAPTVDTTTQFLTVTIAGNPNFPTGYYDGLGFSYSDGFSTQNTTIQSFVNLNNDTFRITLTSAIDFVATATTATIQTVLLTDSQIYIPPSVTTDGIDNEYAQCYVHDYINGSSALITSYDATTRIATLASTVATIPTQYVITKKAYNYTYVLTATTARTVTFTSAVDQQFQQQYIINMENGASAQIQSVVRMGNDYTCTLRGGASAFTSGDRILMAPFTADADVPLCNIAKESGPTQPICYDIQLLTIHIPNVLLAKYPGGFLVDYPYVTVELENITSSHTSSNVFYTNDPKLSRALFICPVQDISSRDYSLFTRLNGSAITQTIKFKINDSLRFTVRLPDGTPVEFTTADTVPPYAPNPLLQISALFALTPSAL